MARYNTKIPKVADKLKSDIDFLIKSGVLVEVKKITKSRTNVQNSALWLYFTHASNALNEMGYYNTIETIFDVKFDLEWDKDSFHDKIWIPLQYAAYHTTSTKDLETHQINPIYDTINKWMSDLGTSVVFPNQFDKYLNMYKN